MTTGRPQPAHGGQIIRLAILGGGVQGRLIARDLASRPDVDEVTVGDIRPPTDMGPKITGRTCDARDPEDVATLFEGVQAGLIAIPGDLGRTGLENALIAGTPLVDISFTPDDLQVLDQRAYEGGSTVVIDCGVAPGLSHILAGAAHQALGGLEKLTIEVGGIPIDPPPGFLHAVYFNPHDLLAEYIRPARHRSDGRDLAPHPLTESPIPYQDSEMGVHDAFLSDGLRTLLSSYPEVPTMTERTLRRPGHLAFMRRLQAEGALNGDPIVPDGESRLAQTANALAQKFPGMEHPDYLLMTVTGIHDGERRSWRLFDKAAGGVSAMARTTGFTAAATAVQLARGRFDSPGIHPPERLGHEGGLAAEILQDLHDRGVVVEERYDIPALYL